MLYAFFRYAQASYSVVWFSLVVVVISTSAGIFYMNIGKDIGNQAQTTSASADKRLDYGLNVISLLGTDGTDKTLEHFMMMFRLSPNSNGVFFRDITFTIYSNNFSHDYAYNDSINCSDLSTYPSSAGYGAGLAFNDNNHSDDRIFRGDIARICFTTPESMSDNSVFNMDILFGASSWTYFSVRFPRGIIHQTENLFP